jgi:hypothetical protein
MNRHPFDAISFITGLLFAGLGVAFMIANISLPDFDWLWPLVAVALGIAIFASARRSEDPAEWRVEPPRESNDAS